MLWIVALQNDRPHQPPSPHLKRMSILLQKGLNLSTSPPSPHSPFQKICSYLRRLCIHIISSLICLVVSTPLKNMSQLGWWLPTYGKISNVPNHQPVMLFRLLWTAPMTSTPFHPSEPEVGLSSEFGQLLLRLGRNHRGCAKRKAGNTQQRSGSSLA